VAVARALEVPMYQLLHEGEEPPKVPNLLKCKTSDDILWGTSGKDVRTLAPFCRLFRKMEDGKPELVLFAAQKMAKRKAV
jgi:hypothetical protein